MHLRTCVSCEGGVLKNSEKTKRGKYGFSIVVYFRCDRRSVTRTSDHAVNRSGGIMRGYMDALVSVLTVLTTYQFILNMEEQSVFIQ